MGFDVENFGVGLLLGWGSAYAVYRSRGVIQRVVQQVQGGATARRTPPRARRTAAMSMT